MRTLWTPGALLTLTSQTLLYNHLWEIKRNFTLSSGTWSGEASICSHSQHLRNGYKTPSNPASHSPSSHFRVLNPLLRRKWAPSIVHCWMVCVAFVLSNTIKIHTGPRCSWPTRGSVSKQATPSCQKRFLPVKAEGLREMSGQRKCASSLPVCPSHLDV